MALVMEIINPCRMPLHGELLRRHPYSFAAQSDFDPRMVTCLESFHPFLDFPEEVRRSSCRGRGCRSKGISSPKWVTHIDVSGFRPEDINVKEVDGEVKIQAERKEGDEDQGMKRLEFKRNIKLPSDVDPKTVRSLFTSDGELTLIGRRRPRNIKLNSPKEMSSTVAAAAAAEKVENDENKIDSEDTDTLTPREKEIIDEEVAKDDQKIVTPDAGVIAEFNLQGFQPNDVRVDVVGDKVVVHAEQDKEEDRVQIKRRFFRSFTVPDKVNIDAITSKFTAEGKILLIEQKTENETDKKSAQPMEDGDDN